MKKFILTALAAGALAAGTAAQAQDIGSIIGSIFGVPSYSYGATPATVAQVYTDQYGRRFYYDQYGRQVYMQDQQQQRIVGYDSWGRPVYGSTYGYGTNTQQIVGYDSWGRPIYGNSGTYAYGGAYSDRDRDGVPDAYDRYPDNPRYR
ncbi:hypothetical protein [Ramlibacter albus]|uniref:RHS repeat protein n=1 Tax=Ramlibacter albus TaxID=2079448 RepID=A0A923M6F6_9BURK|nr:hypothetical protein [Ramlibacter albus]MBC5764671.1 hypothetical protein [Ramlibacter albus]